MLKLRFFRILAAFAVIAVASGCVTAFPTPGSVCRGDLVSVAMGGVKRNFSQNKIPPGDLKAYLTVGNGARTEINIKAVFRAFPDYTSWYARDSLGRDDYAFQYVEPYDGMMWATVQLNDKVNNLPVPSGPGPENAVLELESQSGIFVTAGYVPGQTEGEVDNYPLVIQDCDRTPAQDEVDQYLNYAPRPSLSVRPSDLTGVTDIAGMQLVLTYDEAAVYGQTQGGTDQVYPRLVPISHDPNINIIQTTEDLGAQRRLTVYVTNPMGFLPDSSSAGGWQPGNSTFRDLDFSIISSDQDVVTTWNVGSPPPYNIIESQSFYIDSNGDEIPGVEPVLGLAL